MNYHLIEIIKTNTVIKVGYKAGLFCKLEKTKGKLLATQLKSIGQIIPPKETDIDAYKNHFNNRVTYQAVIKQKTLLTEFLDAWLQFYENYTQMPPKYTGADCNALKAIITHLKKLAAGVDQDALQLWRLILDKWDTLSNFHKSNTDLKYISSKLNIILNAIKQQNNTISHQSSGSVQL